MKSQILLCHFFFTRPTRWIYTNLGSSFPSGIPPRCRFSCRKAGFWQSAWSSFVLRKRKQIKRFFIFYLSSSRRENFLKVIHPPVSGKFSSPCLSYWAALNVNWSPSVMTQEERVLSLCEQQPQREGTDGETDCRRRSRSANTRRQTGAKTNGRPGEETVPLCD